MHALRKPVTNTITISLRCWLYYDFNLRLTKIVTALKNQWLFPWFITFSWWLSNAKIYIPINTFTTIYCLVQLRTRTKKYAIEFVISGPKNSDQGDPRESRITITFSLTQFRSPARVGRGNLTFFIHRFRQKRTDTDNWKMPVSKQFRRSMNHLMLFEAR